jgi:flavin-dependent dehydrogenase
VSLGDADLVVASRTDFDRALFDAAAAAGAHVVRSRAVDVTRDAAGFVVRTADGATIRASAVVGADGATSLVRRRLSQPFTRAELSIATGYFIHGAANHEPANHEPVNPEPLNDEILIEFVSDPPGYIWSFPRPTHLAVGICAQADAGISAAALRDRTLAWMRRMKLDRGALEPYSWPIPSLSARRFDSIETCGAGWYLVGDAAGLVDPITREGIYFALLSGERAAQAIARADGTIARREYRERVREDIVDELQRAARVKAAFFRPRFTRLLVDALRESERVRRVMAGLVAGTQPYKTLKWRLARTAELGLAWRLLRSKWYN